MKQPRHERRTKQVPLANIVVDDGPRPLDAERVGVLAKSMATFGMHSPIFAELTNGEDGFVSSDPDKQLYKIISGRHRVAAAKSLGWATIEALEFADNVYFQDLIQNSVNEDGEFQEPDYAIASEMWAIAENLHRSELNALQRSEQIARWIELERLWRDETQRVLTQVVAKPLGGRPEDGVRSAARELGLNREDARRSVKVAGLSDEAKEAAREVGLDDNRSALLDAASKPSVAEQVAAIHQRANAKPVKLADDPLNDFEAKEKQVAALMSAWNRASPEAREEFMGRVDKPLMDKRYG